MGIQIQISEELWKYLNKEKEKGESLNQVLIRLLKFKKRKNVK